MNILLLTFSMCLSATLQAANDFDLGKIDVVARRLSVGEVQSGQAGSMVTQKEIQTHQRTNVGDALNLLPGVTMSTNARNEKIISVRGFDSRQVPLFIDGIPVYVPFDGYVDFNRFTTADLSSIQISKGFTSMAYGPNALGGAINLISRRPSRPSEADFSFGTGSGEEKRASVNFGSNQRKWYLQSGVSAIESESFPLASGFDETLTENGGARNNSYRKDLKVSAKVGWTPRESDEYALSFYQQNGEKGQPPSTNSDRVRYWQWPYWNKQSLYYVSETALAEEEILKVRLYRDIFDNKVNSFEDGRYRDLRTSGPGSVATGKSIYNDQTNGGSLVLESFRIKDHALSFMGHYKSDEHREFDARGKKMTFFQDEMSSLGIEDSIELGRRLTLSLGYSHHILRPDHVYSRDNPYGLPHEQTANEWQSGIFYRGDDSYQLYTTIASKARMPTLKDRYSQRLGTFIENPGLRREQSLNLETGLKSSTSEVAIFYSDVRDKIQTVQDVVGNQSQVQNVEVVRIFGTEVGHRLAMSSKVEFSGNYTFTTARNVKDSDIKIIDVPRHKAILTSTLKPAKKWEIIPFMEYNSRRWTTNAKELPGFTVFNLKASYHPVAKTVIDIGVTNLGDRNYSLADGFPSPGRMFFASVMVELF